MKQTERTIKMEFKPSEFKKLQDKIWNYSWEDQSIDFALIEFVEDHLSDEDNDYLTEWYIQYRDKEVEELLERNKQ